MSVMIAIGGKELIAWALACVAGFIDAVSYRVLRHLFTAHMSGNSARLGVFLGKANVGSAVPMIAAVALFVFGVGAGTTVAELASRRGARSTMPVLLGIQLLLLAAFMVYGASVIGARGEVAGRWGSGFYLLAAFAIVSIGFQICALQHVGGQHARTTFVSNTLVRFAQEIVNWLFWLHDGAQRPEGSYLRILMSDGRRSESAARMLLFGGIWCLYLGGAIAGSWLDGHWRLWSLACPMAALIALMAIDHWWPFKP